MKARGSFQLAILILAVVLMPALLSAEDEISVLLDNKKGPGAKEIITDRTIYRESKIPDLPVSMEQFEFLLDHPHLSNYLAHLYDRSLDAYRVRIRHNGKIHVEDAPRLAGDVELIHSSEGRRVYFITGYFAILTIRFEGQMVVNTMYTERSGPTVYVDTTTESYIKINNIIAGALAKLVSFLLPSKVDQRIDRFIHAVKTVAEVVHRDPADAYRKLALSGEIDAEERKGFERMFLKQEAENPEINDRGHDVEGKLLPAAGAAE